MGYKRLNMNLVYHTQVPIVSYVPNTIFPQLHNIMGSIEFPSVTSDLWTGSAHPMSFYQRMVNIASGYFQVWIYKYYIIPYL